MHFFAQKRILFGSFELCSTRIALTQLLYKGKNVSALYNRFFQIIAAIPANVIVTSYFMTALLCNEVFISVKMVFAGSINWCLLGA